MLVVSYHCTPTKFNTQDIRQDLITMIATMTMPKMGESVMECTIISVLKKAGERVEADESVFEVATDKVDTEVPSPFEGIIEEILVKEGDVVAIGSTVMRIQTETTTDASTEAAPEVPVADAAVAALASLETQLNAFVPSVAPTPPHEASSSTRFYSPLVLTIAKAENISIAELETIPGSGADKRVTKKDILDYLQTVKNKPTGNTVQTTDNKPTSNPAPTTNHKQPHQSSNIVLPMDRMRRVIAERMVESKRISAHVTSFVETDMTNVALWRNRVKDEFKKQTGEGITFTPILIEAVVKAIKDFPLINVSVEGDNILQKRDINVGMAVALPSGNLIVPVIHNADQYSLIGLTKKVNDLANRARNNKLTADDLANGTYTISNIGAFGNIMGTPIIVQPQVAIMAFGVIQKKPVVIETPQGDTFGVRQMMYISHSYDHRVVDGALGGMFVKRVSDYLEGFDLERKLF
jgi:2-oxoglutarate dehydrogenase E2 component (dihydrolipoamide succinyltransferase)